MIPVLTAAQSRACDQGAIEGWGLPGIALMEVASRGVARVVRELSPRRVVCVCGGGNNGGDGYGAARWLHLDGIEVAIWALKEPSTGDSKTMAAVCDAMGIERVDGLGDADVIVDGILGTGVTRAIEGELAEVVEAINAHPAKVVAVDLPSGLDGDTGGPLGGPVVQADRTVTFGYAKRGLFGPQGITHAGRWQVEPLPVPEPEGDDVAMLVEPSDVAGLWPRRAEGGHKTRSGHLLVVAGSRNMAGAAVLCCLSALKAGTGLVTLAIPAGALPRLGALPPEVMVHVAGDGDVVDVTALPEIGRFTAVAVGPGLGGGEALPEATVHWLRRVWVDGDVAVVADADALVAVAGPGGAGERVVTPHPGEAGRMLSAAAGFGAGVSGGSEGVDSAGSRTRTRTGTGIGADGVEGSVSGSGADRRAEGIDSAGSRTRTRTRTGTGLGADGVDGSVSGTGTGTGLVQADRFSAVRALAGSRVAALLKGPYTLVAGADGIRVLPVVCPVLSTGGSGDVLTGLIGSLLARGLGAQDAAVLGGYVHGQAGLALARRRTTGHTAGDIARALPAVIDELMESRDAPGPAHR